DLLVAVGEACERLRVAARRVVEALAVRERVGANVQVLPGAVVVERLPFEVAEADVVQVGVDLGGRRVRALTECEARGLLGAWELGGDAKVDRDRAHLRLEL